MIEAQYTPTISDVAKGVIAQLRTSGSRRTSRIVGFTIVAMWLLALPVVDLHKALPHFWLAPIVALLMAFGDVILGYAAAIIARKVACRPLSFEFGEDNYRIESPGTVTNVEWHGVMEILDGKHGFLIRSNKYSGVYIPNHAFVGGTDGFRNLIQRLEVKIRKI